MRRKNESQSKQKMDGRKEKHGRKRCFTLKCQPELMSSALNILTSQHKKGERTQISCIFRTNSVFLGVLTETQQQGSLRERFGGANGSTETEDLHPLG